MLSHYNIGRSIVCMFVVLTGMVFGLFAISATSYAAIANGIYKITSAAADSSGSSTKYCIDLSGGRGSIDHWPVVVYQDNGTIAQQWYIEKQSSGYYAIYSMTSRSLGQQVLDVAGGGTANGTDVSSYHWNGTDAQLWTIVENSDGTVSFKNKKSEKMIDVSGGVAGNGTNVQIYQSNGTAAQKWRLEQLSSGTQIIPQNAGYSYLKVSDNLQPSNVRPQIVSVNGFSYTYDTSGSSYSWRTPGYVFTLNGNASTARIQLRWSQVGTFKGRPVGCTLTITNPVTTDYSNDRASYNSDTGEWEDNTPAGGEHRIAINNRFSKDNTGFDEHFLHRMLSAKYQFQFFYTDDSSYTPIDLGYVNLTATGLDEDGGGQEYIQPWSSNGWNGEVFVPSNATTFRAKGNFGSGSDSQWTWYGWSSFSNTNLNTVSFGYNGSAPALTYADNAGYFGFWFDFNAIHDPTITCPFKMGKTSDGGTPPSNETFTFNVVSSAPNSNTPARPSGTGAFASKTFTYAGGALERTIATLETYEEPGDYYYKVTEATTVTGYITNTQAFYLKVTVSASATDGRLSASYKWYSDSAFTNQISSAVFANKRLYAKVTPVKSVSAPQFNLTDIATYTIKATQTVQDAFTASVTLEDDFQKSGTIIGNGATFVPESLKVTGPTGTDITSNATLTWISNSKFKLVVPQRLGYNQAITVTYKVRMGTTSSTVLQKKNYVNEVVATCQNQDPTQAANPLRATATVYIREPNLTCEKNVDKAFIDAGDTALYTLKMTNTGGDANSIAYNVKFVDTLPSELIVAGATVKTRDITVVDSNGNTVACTPRMNGNVLTIATDLDLADGKGATATVPVKFGDRSNVMSGKKYENTVVVSSDNSNTATAKATVEVSDPVLETTKVATEDAINTSERCHFTVTGKNTTPNSKAYNVSFTDALDEDAAAAGAYIDMATLIVKKPDGSILEPTSYQVLATERNGRFVGFKLNTSQTLATNEVLTITFEVVAGETTSVALQETEIPNTAQVNASNSTKPGNEASDTVEVLTPHLVSAKTVDKEFIDAGDSVIYTLKAENTGGEAGSIAWNVKLVDTLPEQLISDGVIVNTSAVVVKDHNGQIVTAKVNMSGAVITIETDVDLPDGKTMIVEVPMRFGDRGNIMSGRIYENTLEISSDNSNKDQSRARIEISDPKLETTKVATEDTINTSERCHFTVTGTNKTEKTTAYNVSFADRITDAAADAGAWIDMNTFVIVMPNGSQLGPSEYTLTPVKKQDRVIGFDIATNRTLTYGQIMTITYDVVAGETTSINLQDTSIPNTAQVNASNSKNPGNQASDIVEVYTPELTIIKEALQSIANVADHVPYKITVEQVVEGAIAWNIHLIDDIQTDFATLGGHWDMDSFHVTDPSGTERTGNCTFTVNQDKNRLDIATPISLAHHEKMTVTYDVIFGETTSAALQGHDYTNIVTATADNTRKDVSDDAVVYVPVPRAHAVKSVDKPVINVADQVVYTLIAENVGEDGSCLRNVVLTDVMPEKMISAGAMVDISGIKATHTGQDLPVTPILDGNILKIETGRDLYKGEVVTVTVPVTFGDHNSWELCGVTWTNELTVSSDNADPATDTADVTVLKPELDVIKKADKHVLPTYQLVSYTAETKVLNEDAIAFNVRFDDGFLWIGDEGAIDPEKIAESVKISLDGSALNLDEKAVTVEGSYNAENRTGTISIAVETGKDLSYGSIMTMSYDVCFGERAARAAVNEQIVDNIVTVSSSNGGKATANEKIEIIDAVLDINKSVVVYDPSRISYETRVSQTRENTIAFDVKADDRLDAAAIAKGVFINRDVSVAKSDGTDITSICPISYVSENGHDVGYSVSLPDLAFGEEVVIRYTADAQALSGLGVARIDNVVGATASNAQEVFANATCDFDGGVAETILTAQDDLLSNKILYAGIIAAMLMGVISLIRRRFK